MDGTRDDGRDERRDDRGGGEPIPALGADVGWQVLTERLHEGFMVGEVIRAEGAAPDFRHLYVNAAWSRLTGLDATELLGRPVGEAQPGLEAWWAEELARVVETQHPATFTRAVAMLERTYEVRAFPLGGALFGLLFLDATERERDATVRRRRADAVERRLTATVSEGERTWDVTPDLLVVFDGDGRFVHSNPAWERTLGWSREFLERTVFFDLLHPHDLARTRAEHGRVTSLGEPALAFENRYRHVDGTWRWLSWVAVPEDGRVYCTARDVTVHKERQNKLAARNRFWDASPDLYVVIGLDGFYREANPAWSTVLGHDPELLGGLGFDALVHPDQVEAAHAEFATMLAGGRMQDHEVAIRAADGAYRWYSFTGFVEGDAVLVIGRDIDERRRREAELEAAGDALRQSQKLEMIGQLTGGIAHDFNNLLMAMQSSLELLDGELGPEARAARRLVTDALAGAARGTALTQRLLAFARKQELVPTALDVGELVRGIEDMLVHSLGPRVRLRLTIADGVPPASVDGNQLEMALLNLAVNARDAMDEVGDLALAVESRTATGGGPLTAGTYVRIAMTDTGRGMDAATLERAAEPFFTTKAVGSGTGLGLSTIHGLAEQSGGRFRLRSEPGVGTVAEILLPRATGPAVPPVPAPAPPSCAGASPARPRRVLVVDDDELVLRGLTGMLERLGHTVRGTRSAALTLQALALEEPPDVVITDQLMPGMTGLALAAVVRREYPGPALILATGYNDAGEGEDGLLDARLLKPFNRAKLEAVLAGV